MLINGSETTKRLLVVEDAPESRNLLGLALKRQGYAADFLEDAAEAAVQIRKSGLRYSAVLVSIHSEGQAASLVFEAKRQQPAIPVIAVTTAGRDVAGLGVSEVVESPFTGETLRRAIQKCLVEPPIGIWSKETSSVIRDVAAADVPVLVQGETGAGKEVLARQLHTLSPRAKRPFLKVNCAALPSELIESELFGYERGAFTGAFKNTAGKFEMAEGGSILLDEIGDMDFKLQAKLLQVLQDSEFIRLGSSEPRKVDVRVFAATHCDLERAISEKRFREDLYYRLNIVTFRVPPLRERKDEILPLANHFLRKHATQTHPVVEITPALRDALLAHNWPGNIRELENVIRRVLVLRRPDLVADDIINRCRKWTAVSVVETAPPEKEIVTASVPIPIYEEPEMDVVEPMPQRQPFEVSPPVVVNAKGRFHDSMGTFGDAPIRSVPSAPGPVPVADVPPWSVLDRVNHARREAETEAILQALNSTLWNRKRAAQLLKIDYKALLYKMKKLGIVERAVQIAM